MSRSYYDVQQVCLNGHQITDRYKEYSQHRRDYCKDCGAETIHECPECGESIQGRYVVPGFVGGSNAPVPTHCEACGESFPWTDEQEGVSEGSADESLVGDLGLVMKVCERFHLVARHLEERHDDRETLVVEDEYDVQDLMHALLRVFFDDIRREDANPEYAGKSSRVDFLLKGERIVLEIKMTRDRLGKEKIGDQLLADIGRYHQHPSAETLVCFVYDPDHRITNPRGLEDDLTGEREGLEYETLIEPY